MNCVCVGVTRLQGARMRLYNSSRVYVWCREQVGTAAKQPLSGHQWFQGLLHSINWCHVVRVRHVLHVASY
jgi:hypothetical protein